MLILSAQDAKYSLGGVIDLARAGAGGLTWKKPVAVAMGIEKCERLKGITKVT
ncbi:hypothetical protein OAN307_c40140 [Octadecabacter antarcticus 307]|uniref:Uncharacterized protein n=1 Tax=Octadecabacter antarcticus 307 TaxID=391626 RepID=M9RHY7_9RHOB|nr:hypothetical protein [Octadecabacter antarcticus]AGI69435.1 hypothetical protein OAN307_c40140 [Octadecabacter antarcticus 307]